MLEQELFYVTWEDFKNEIQSWFNQNKFEDHIGELIKLLQVGSIVNYKGKFKQLLAKFESLIAEKIVSYFVTRLNIVFG